MTRRRAKAIALLLAMTAVGCGDDDDVTTDGGSEVDGGSADASASDGGPCRADTTSDDPAFQDYLDYLKTFMTANDVPGVAVAILDGQGRVRHQALLGAKGPGSCAGALTADTRFRMASIANVVTATAVVAAASEGLIKLDDPITTHLPELTTSVGDPSSIRIGHLLTYTAGVPARFLGTCPGSLDDWLTARNNLPIWFAPGSAYQLAHHQPLYAALAIDRAAGALTFEDVVRTRVFDKLGMTSTYSQAVFLAGDHATGSPAEELSDCPSDRPSNQLFVSLSDLIKLTGFFMKGDPAVMSPALHAKLREVPGSPHFYPEWASGYALFKLPYGADGTVIYDVVGQLRGFGVEIVLAPDKDLAVVVMINRDLGSYNYLQQIAFPAIDRFGSVAGTPAPWCNCNYNPPIAPKPVSTWGEYAGRYVDAIGVPTVPPPRNFDVSFDGSRLWLALDGITVELTPDTQFHGEDVFAFTFLGVRRTIRFYRNPTTGVPSMISARGNEIGPPAFRLP